jgi:putative ABC transport system permease protein
VADAGQIVLMANRYPKAGIADSTFSGSGDYFDRLSGVTALEDQALFQNTSFAVDLQSSVEQVEGMRVTPSWFRLVRAQLKTGRGFTENEAEPGNDQVVVLSEGLARQLNVGTGGAVRMNGQPRQVVGILPAGFTFIDPDVRFWIPQTFTAEEKLAHHSNNWVNAGRLRTGASIEQAQAQVDAINRANLDRFPHYREIVTNAGFQTKVMPLAELLVRNIRSSLYLLWGAALFVLLIGGLNIANLAVARVRARQKEWATRMALGATRVTLWRLLCAESVWLALPGAAAGVALAQLLIAGLRRFGLDQFPRAGEVQLDAASIAMAVMLALAAAILATVIPASGMARTPSLREDNRAGSRSARLRQALVTAEVAFAFVLLAGAGLLLASFGNLLSVDPGFATRGVLTAGASLPASRYPEASQRIQAATRILEAIRALPGVQAAGLTTSVPLGGNYSDSVIIAEGYQMKPGESLIAPFQSSVSPGYFEAMGMKVVRGRAFDGRDHESAPLAMVIDESLARKFFGVSDPLGRRLYLPANPEELTKGPGPDTRWRTVVGVVRSIRMDDLNGGRGTGAYYLPWAQQPAQSFTLTVRGGVPMRMVRGAIAGVDRELAVFDVHSMEERLDLSLASRRASVTLASGFAALALFLSGIGLYGVLAYLVHQRRREFAIRMAIGGSQSDVAALVLREALALVGIGLGLGVAGTIAIRQAMEGQIYGVSALDPAVLTLVGAVLSAIALAACLVPAGAAVRTDPARVLADS